MNEVEVCLMDAEQSVLDANQAKDRQVKQRMMQNHAKWEDTVGMKQLTGFDAQASVLSFEDCQLLARHNIETGIWTHEQADGWLEELQKAIILKQRKESSLVLKPVSELLGKFYFVDKYQRGYKWNVQQVRELLDDIDRFTQEQSGSFYCLQPVVVKYLEEKDKWELIDGQQRMTTIYLILSYLGRDAYDISYETRESSSDFLKNIVSYIVESGESWDDFIARTDKCLDNVDNYHFFQAYQTIVKWFTGKDEAAISRWYETLLNHTKVIWYDAWAEGSDTLTAIDIFMRINSGKIPLTNAELIKAHFLHNVAGQEEDEKLFRLRQIEMAQEWDGIEQKLQDDDFWYFVSATPDEDMPNRIELIFDILAKKPAKNDNDFYTFDHYLKCTDISTEWKTVKRCFAQLVEWYEDYEKYHLIGFVVSRRLTKLSLLLDESRVLGKTAFTQRLKAIIKQNIRSVEEFDELRYGEHNKELIDVLLLFNLLTLLQSHASTRFSFERFVKETWSLEHVHAQNSEALSDAKKAESWYAETKALIGTMPSGEKETLQQQLDTWHETTNKKSDAARQLLSGLQNALYRQFGDEDDEVSVHGIENMALLDKDTNSALNNAIFEVKRRRIIEKDKEGVFIPICTKNLFSKYYSSQVSHMHYWSRSDREDYKQAIKLIFKHYFQEVGK